ncbi:hypothetical protein GCM10012285_36750 [Streptomyces kronopolitis]|uniref:Uncharacterized protein n=1 Tax=Streptomyces kronopolitis TaxID=1612435 RepID=A0ABQ2JLK4_9ACTN|nr:hypothetical protein GCM10012285_36750 [Streptomyces kronopolitis]
MHFRVPGTFQTGVDGAISPLGGLIERRLLACPPLNADRGVGTRTRLGVRQPDEAPHTAREGIGNAVRCLRLDPWRGAEAVDRRAAIRTGQDSPVRRVGGRAPGRSASASDRRSATTTVRLRACCIRPSPRARCVSG